MNDKSLFYTFFLICQGKKTKSGLVSLLNTRLETGEKMQRITEKTQIFLANLLTNEVG